VALIVCVGYIGWAFITGSLRLGGREQPIRRQDSPREYWYYMSILTVILAAAVAMFAWMFL